MRKSLWFFWSVFTLMIKRINWGLAVLLWMSKLNTTHICAQRRSSVYSLGQFMPKAQRKNRNTYIYTVCLMSYRITYHQETRWEGATFHKQQCQCHKSCQDVIQGWRYLCTRQAGTAKRKHSNLKGTEASQVNNTSSLITYHGLIRVIKSCLYSLILWH